LALWTGNVEKLIVVQYLINKTDNDRIFKNQQSVACPNNLFFSDT